MVLVRLRVVDGSMELGERSERLSKQLDSRLASVRQSAADVVVAGAGTCCGVLGGTSPKRVACDVSLNHHTCIHLQRVSYTMILLPYKGRSE